MIHIEIPEDVKNILDILRKAGYEAYAVGGCVRDSLLGKIPKDWDITTSALPYQVKELFIRTVDTGIKHGTVTVLLHGIGYEITTYRIDGEYLDGRHPSKVSFTASLEEDLKRRDFTINAFAYSEETGVKDLFGGLEDLKNKTIKCVGNPEERFNEDALRILRAVRFSAQLGFEIERDTFAAAVKLRDLITKVSSERIKSELDKTLLSDNPGHFTFFDEMGLDEVILQEFSSLKEIYNKTGKSGFEVLSASLKISDKNPVIRWSLVFYFTEKSISRKNISDKSSYLKVMQMLKFDNKTRDKVVLFIRNSDRNLPVRYMESFRTECRKLISIIGSDSILEYISFREAIAYAEGTEEIDFKPFYSEINDIFKKNECTSLKNLHVNGNDIKNEDLAKGAEIGTILNSLLNVVLENPEMNERTKLLDYARNMKG